METVTALRRMQKKEAGYRRARLMWRCVTVLGWLGWAGSMAIRQMPGGTVWDVLKVACPTAFLALLILSPGKRARRAEAAARTIDIAVVRFEANPDGPESVLNEAALRAREIMRLERMRKAPEWIRGQRRRYRLRILAWLLPALVVVAPPAGAAILQWQWVEPWHMAAFLGAFLLYCGAATLGTRKPMKARDILGQAIERYEYESAGTESELAEASRQAAEVLPVRGGPPELAK